MVAVLFRWKDKILELSGLVLNPLVCAGTHPTRGMANTVRMYTLARTKGVLFFPVHSLKWPAAKSYDIPHSLTHLF